MSRSIVVGVCTLISLWSAPSARAQCDQPFTVDLFSSYRTSGEPLPGELQHAGASGWIFREPDALATLLVGTLLNTRGVWGDPTQPFSVPLAGPVASPDPAKNRLEFFDRPLSLDAVFLHPGYDNRHLVIDFVPTTAVTLLGATLEGEVVGDISDGVLVSLVADRISGDVTLVPQARINYTAGGHATLSAGGGNFPLDLAGMTEKVRVVVENGGAPFEDWLCGQVTLTMRGGPVIYAQPRNAGACQATPTVLRVGAAGSGDLTYAWEFAPGSGGEFEALADGVTPGGSTISGSGTDTLTIVHAGPGDGGRYRARITGPCNVAVSSDATITICVSDYDCSGFVDTDDFTAFVLDFEAGVEQADVDGTGFVDTDDFTFFVLAFESGC
ncbi:MAG TPA: GC-type dockerin domain-anchored protein [Phycisphaerales bacterium]|nr:GC-type dockerin domain-anchored protein [Phycisphaerales bacterium]